MTQPLDYAIPPQRRPSRLLTFLANLTLLYPLFFLLCLYGQWYLSWFILGHQPIPSLDDPKYIQGASWMHPFTLLALMGLLPALIGALTLNSLHITLNDVPLKRIAMRVGLGIGLWAALFLIRWDPQPVVEWWMD